MTHEIFPHLIWCIPVNVKGFPGLPPSGLLKPLPRPCFAWQEQEMDADGAVLERMGSLLHTDANEWKNCCGCLKLRGWWCPLIIKSGIDLICSLLTLKQLIISNPMTHLLLKCNMFKRSLFYLCIIGLGIYAVRWQLTVFVYSPLMFRAKCALTASLPMSVS